MNFVGEQISDALQVWDNAQKTVQGRSKGKRSSGSSGTLSPNKNASRKQSNLDMTFITPSIIALGRLNESKAEDLAYILRGQPSLLWNLSGKSLPDSITEKLNCQVLDFPWTTPGHFTQAPTIECVFRQCYSVHAWLSLKRGNVAVVHCGNGKSRSGILIACYLRYIGNYKNTLESFHFFCKKRLQTNNAPVLSPSYQILFENVDRATERGGRPNPFPLHLKCLAVSGLPVDDMPCLEVWDKNGLVFNSHNGMTPSPTRCAWSTEYGDGFFRVAADLQGDFSVMCRFGGGHALTRDKTTLIFKYQNSTGFLPPDVIELSKSKVDVNPEYADSLDNESFTVHLMFDAVSEASMRRIKADKTEFLDAYLLRGHEAFDTGLNEISQYHIVEPRAAVCTALGGATCPEEYKSVLAQLANNDSAVALKIMQFVMKRSMLLSSPDSQSPKPPLPTSPYMVKHAERSLGINRSGDKARQSMQTTYSTDDTVQKLFLDEADPFEKSPLQKAIEFKGRVDEPTATLQGIDVAGNRAPKHSIENEQMSNTNGSFKENVETTNVTLAVAASKSEQNRIPDSDDDSIDEVESVAEDLPASRPSSPKRRPPPPPLNVSGSKCLVCGDDSSTKEDQIVNCVDCNQSFHAVCVGGRRIPFTLKSAKERENRTKYIAKHYGGWRCEVCKVKHAEIVEDKIGSPKHGSTENRKREYINDSSNEDGGLGQRRVKTKSQDMTVLMDILSKNGVSIDSLARMEEGEQKQVLLSATASYSSDIQNDLVNQLQFLVPVNDKANITQNGNFKLSSETEKHGVELKDDRRYFKYFKMHQVGLPTNIIETKMKAEGLDPTVVINQISGVTLPLPPDYNSRAISTGQQVNVSSSIGRGSQQTLSSSSCEAASDSQGRLNELAGVDNSQQLLPKQNPRYTKYFNMLQVGLPLSAVAQKLLSDGHTTSVQLATDILQNKIVTANSAPKATTSVLVETSMVSGSAGGLNGTNAPEKSLSTSAAQQIGGQASEQQNNIKKKQPEEKNEKDKDVHEIEPSSQENDTGKENELNEAEPRVVIGESMMYGKYFRMLKVGLPVPTIKMKMRQAGLNPDMLDKKPTDTMTMSALAASRLQRLRSHSSSGDIDSQQQQAKENIEEEPRDDENKPNAKDSGETIALKDHPVFGKYFKMLQVGLPLALVRSKMKTQEADGGKFVDPTVLERDPTDQYPIELPDREEEAEEEEETVALKDHPEYAKYLKMLKVGLPLVAAKAKMKEDGYDPDLLDRELTDQVPVDVNSTLRKKEKARQLSPSSPKTKIRKKKLHWKAIDKSKVGADSLWADDDDDGDDIRLDDDEFNMLFVESDANNNTLATSLAKSSKEANKKKSLIDMKRGQNGGIALARLKLSLSEVRECIMKMDDSVFSSEQYRSLQEFLPTEEEAAALRRHVGDPEQLGVAERYMLEMINNMSSPQVAHNCLECILYKQQFKFIQSELNDSIARIENACDDVKMSPKLKKVMKTILKVGNQMNDGEDQHAFSLDSLLKLQSAKAFDKKTSVLQYIVRLIYRNDESCLLFPEDLKHLSDATRISVDAMLADKANLDSEQEKCLRLVEELRREASGDVELSSMESFLQSTAKSIISLDKKIKNMQKKYESVLSYFGEDSSMSSTEFFETLQTFVNSFIQERALAEQFRKAEARKNASANAAASRQSRAVTLNHIDVDPNLSRGQNLSPHQSMALAHLNNINNMNSPNKPLPKKPARRSSTFI